jgi:hypothetical protein
MIGTSQHELKIPYIGFLLSITSTSVLFTWLHNRAQGSIWMAVFFHWIYTYCAQVIASGVTRTPIYTSWEFVPHIIVALVVILIWKAEFLKQPYSAVETTS